MKKLLLGTNFTNGLLGKIVIYAILIVLSFVFIFPLINMITVGLMSNLDLADHSIEWIPSEFYLENFRLTWRALRLPGSYFTTVLVAGVSTVCLMLSSALISYGLARFQVPGKFLIFSLLLFTYLAPKVLFFIPRYQLFTTLGLSGNMGALIFPALMGQGEQAALFILIFYQFSK
ncbi:hypothetical protein ACR73B_06660 [Enterococcus innesii]|uniref:hypothetical protein n=1 Tax=Enterococcus innesii TaxID=2839759 RepID=UPI003DA32C56